MSGWLGQVGDATRAVRNATYTAVNSALRSTEDAQTNAKRQQIQSFYDSGAFCGTIVLVCTIAVGFFALLNNAPVTFLLALLSGICAYDVRLTSQNMSIFIGQPLQTTTFKGTAAAGHKRLINLHIKAAENTLLLKHVIRPLALSAFPPPVGGE